MFRFDGMREKKKHLKNSNPKLINCSISVKLTKIMQLLVNVYLQSPPLLQKQKPFEKLSFCIDQISTAPRSLHSVCRHLKGNLLKKPLKLTLITNQMEMNALVLVEPQTPTRETRQNLVLTFFYNFNSKRSLRKL